MKLLYDADQLRNQITDESAFVGFHEMETNFLPTYRLIREECFTGKRAYNEEKGRVPSWCDRILWKTFPDCTLEPIKYDCVPSITTSDHIPVYATFKLETRVSPEFLNSVFNWDRKIGMIYIKDLKAKGLDWVKDETASKRKKLPSPMVKFRAFFLPPKCHSEVIPFTNEPVWGSFEYTVIQIPNTVYFETQHIMLQIVTPVAIVKKSAIVTKTANAKVKKNAALGQAILSMKGTTGSHPKRFLEPITYYGVIVGYIAGSVHLIPNSCI